MLTNPKVSVIIPTFNRAYCLHEAIDSVLVQTFQDFELIVVDDGSSDNTLEVVRGYGPKIKCIYQENKGLSSARNRGIKEASGEFVAFLDSDDIWLPEKLNRQIDIFQKENIIGLVSTRAEVIDEQGNSLGIYKPKKFTSSDLSGLLNAYFVVISSVMVRRSALDSLDYYFDESLKSAEDFDFCLRLSRVTQLYYLDNVEVKYRDSLNAMSKNLVKMYYSRIQILKKFSDRLRNQKDNVLVKAKLSKDYYCLAHENRKQNKWFDFFRYYIKSKFT